MKSVYIVPTGDEILNGTVTDLDTPEIMKQLVEEFPEANVTRVCPLVDNEKSILEQIDEIISRKPDLVVMVGGSGGGHRYSATLGKDFTHSALEQYLDEKHSKEIYGKNGHLWSKLVCGKKGNTLVFNVPGPFTEAKAACAAFIENHESGDLEVINKAMADAVYNMYPKE